MLVFARDDRLLYRELLRAVLSFGVEAWHAFAAVDEVATLDERFDVTEFGGFSVVLES
jgi:hypothetical protein